ncbi:MAG: sulfite exporter TauE/SafE family protein [Halobacteriovoraceae bacterium]|nr:sulfite exporter TauE/SafE family protein [Halobacteriovoraceae bacterium]
MILGFSLATLIGLSLGLMGGGGSILTVPILVYALDMDPKLSIALSLAIVGLTSFVGSIAHLKAKNINLKIALIFGPVAMLGTYIGAKYLSAYFSGAAQLVLFSLVMLVASVFMFKGRTEREVSSTKALNYPLIMTEGLLVGLLTGVVGVGGGFMIVPALVLLANIPMKQAIGTSLFIISFKSFAGFYGYLGNFEIPWNFLGQFSIFTIIGILIGSHLVKYVSAKKLKKGFAIFLIIMGVFILYKNRYVFI